MLSPQYLLPIDDELVVDLFAGGGGASTGIEAAIGRHVDIAINHDADAVSLHEANHPQTRHFCSDVFEVDPLQATGGRPVGLLHASPDCTHHSQARGGQPRSRAIRSLSWVVHRWAGTLSKRGCGPRVITLENVEQILQWSPLVAKRCPKTGRVIRTDGTVAPAGERTPIDEQFLVPDTSRKGHNWRHFVEGLRRMGYVVQWRSLVAADFGAPTTRTRLFMVARNDCAPIVWPAPTHHKKPGRGQRRWRAAAECIDWSLPTPSIFERPRPLADATLRRIAKGVRKYVLEAAQPFVLRIAQQGALGPNVRGVDEPVSTVTSKAEHALVAPTLVQAGYGEQQGQAPRALDLQQPLGTVVAGGMKHALASAVLLGVGGRAAQTEPRPANETHFTTTGKADAAVAVAYMAQMNGGFHTSPGHSLDRPCSSITAAGSQQQLVAAMLTHAYSSNTCGGEGDLRLPAKTITTGGHHALLECRLSPEAEEGALRVAAFLMRYYGEGGQLGDPELPLATITTRDRLALVTVTIQGTPYVVVDIGLRMLQPRELYSCQGFPSSYIIDRRADGRPLPKSAQVRMCGNSVSPRPMEALVRENYAAPAAARRAA